MVIGSDCVNRGRVRSVGRTLLFYRHGYINDIDASDAEMELKKRLKGMNSDLLKEIQKRKEWHDVRNQRENS